MALVVSELASHRNKRIYESIEFIKAKQAKVPLAALMQKAGKYMKSLFTC